MKTGNFHSEPAYSNTAGHLSLAQLRRYQADALPVAEQHRVENHLLDCELCADILAGMEEAPLLQTQNAVTEINKRVTIQISREKRPLYYAGWQNLRVAAAILVLLLSGALVFYYNLTKTKSENISQVKQKTAEPENKTILKPTEPAAVAATVPSKPDSDQQNTIIASDKPKSKVGKYIPQKVAAGPQASATATFNNEISTDSTTSIIPMDSESDAKKDAKELAVLNKSAAPVAPVVAGRISDEGNRTKVQIRGRTEAIGSGSVRAGQVVTGRVLSEEGEALPGVTILVKGTTSGTITSSSGDFNISLLNPAEKITLVYSFVGYETLEKEVDLRKPDLGEIKLRNDNRSLSEVVVTEYGKTTTDKANTEAKPVTGIITFNKYIAANLKYPVEARRQRLEGKVIVKFTVNPDGSQTNFRVTKSLSPACDAEALRVIKAGPNWAPAKKDGQAIAETVRVVVNFDLP